MRRAPLIIAACLALSAVPALAAGGPNRISGDCTKSQVRPAVVVLACADGNAYVNHIAWTSFGGATGAGSGSYVLNDCTPNCAGGKFHSYPVKFTLSNAKRCPDGHDDYRRMAITFTGARPSTLGAHFNQQLFCPIG
ncbi:MAG TPA: hypothetical protein VL977_05220 [Solirubrobacteraceae bacterium]|nr:hypothetical protein [Solirubrobacteraceae bacterium]